MASSRDMDNEGERALMTAIGETPDFFLLPKGVDITDANTVAVDPITLETSRLGVFAGGDAARARWQYRRCMIDTSWKYAIVGSRWNIREAGMYKSLRQR